MSQNTKDWIKAAAMIAVFAPITIAFLTIRKTLLVAVELIEAAFLLYTRWILIPVLCLLGLDSRYHPQEPDLYHYHNTRDAIADKLGAGWRYWRNL